jgi:hypothetical protein
VTNASTTNRWAPFTEWVDPLRSLAAAITGALVGVETSEQRVAPFHPGETAAGACLW